MRFCEPVKIEPSRLIAHCQNSRPLVLVPAAVTNRAELTVLNNINVYLTSGRQ